MTQGYGSAGQLQAGKIRLIDVKGESLEELVHNQNPPS
jgi:hypothetical protein